MATTSFSFEKEKPAPCPECMDPSIHRLAFCLVLFGSERIRQKSRDTLQPLPHSVVSQSGFQLGFPPATNTSHQTLTTNKWADFKCFNVCLHSRTCAAFSPGPWHPPQLPAFPLSVADSAETLCPGSRTASPSLMATCRCIDKHDRGNKVSFL